MTCPTCKQNPIDCQCDASPPYARGFVDILEKRIHDLEAETDLLRQRLNALGEDYGLDFSQSEFFNYHPQALPLFHNIWSRLAKLEKMLSPAHTNYEPPRKL